MELRERSIAEKHILENVLIFVFTVDILLGIMGLFSYFEGTGRGYIGS